MDIAKLKSINAKILLVKSNIEHKKNEILMTEAQIKNLNDRLLLQNETLKKLVMKEIIKDEPRVPVDNWDLNYHLKSLTSVVEALPFGAPQFLIQNGSPIEDNSCNIFLNSDIEFGNLLQEDFRQWMGSISLPQTTPRDIIVKENSKERKARMTRERQKRWRSKQSEERLDDIRTKGRERTRLKRMSASEEELMKVRLADKVAHALRRKKAFETGEIYAMRAKEAERQRQCRLMETEEQARRRRLADATRRSLKRMELAMKKSIDPKRENVTEEQRQNELFEIEKQIQKRRQTDLIKSKNMADAVENTELKIVSEIKSENSSNLNKIAYLKPLSPPRQTLMKRNMATEQQETPRKTNKKIRCKRFSMSTDTQSKTEVATQLPENLIIRSQDTVVQHLSNTTEIPQKTKVTKEAPANQPKDTYTYILRSLTKPTEQPLKGKLITDMQKKSPKMTTKSILKDSSDASEISKSMISVEMHENPTKASDKRILKRLLVPQDIPVIKKESDIVWNSKIGDIKEVTLPVSSSDFDDTELMLDYF